MPIFDLLVMKRESGHSRDQAATRYFPGEVVDVCVGPKWKSHRLDANFYVIHLEVSVLHDLNTVKERLCQPENMGEWLDGNPGEQDRKQTLRRLHRIHMIEAPPVIQNAVRDDGECHLTIPQLKILMRDKRTDQAVEI